MAARLPGVPGQTAGWSSSHARLLTLVLDGGSHGAQQTEQARQQQRCDGREQHELPRLQRARLAVGPLRGRLRMRRSSSHRMRGQGLQAAHIRGSSCHDWLDIRLCRSCERLGRFSGRRKRRLHRIAHRAHYLCEEDPGAVRRWQRGLPSHRYCKLRERRGSPDHSCALYMFV